MHEQIHNREYQRIDLSGWVGIREFATIDDSLPWYAIDELN